MGGLLCFSGIDRGWTSGKRWRKTAPPATARQGAASPGNYRLGVWIEPVSAMERQELGALWTSDRRGQSGQSGRARRYPNRQRLDVGERLPGDQPSGVAPGTGEFRRPGVSWFVRRQGVHIAASPVIRLGSSRCPEHPRAPAPSYAPAYGSNGSIPAPLASFIGHTMETTAMRRRPIPSRRLRATGTLFVDPRVS